ncbi:MAG: PAS domain S-box protein [Terriglobales bacterium]|jgi:two-component system cell cycle sensor histidine kinase/response regulator CckA
MGDQITQPATLAELARAKFLREALQRRTLVVPGQAETITASTETITPSFAPDSPELQRAYLEQLVECAPEAISILDPDYRITRLNGEFTRIFGFGPAEALGQRIDSLIVPPDRSAETRWIGELLVKGQKVVLETKRQRKDGTLLDVFISTAPIMNEGKQVAMCVLYRDITEQKRTEALHSALHRITEETSTADDLPQFYDAVHEIVGELMYARNFYIAIYDPLTQLLNFAYFEDETDSRPAPRRLGKGLTEYVLRSGEPLLCTPEVFDGLARQKEVESIGAPSLDWLGVPLKAGSNTFGVVVVQSYSANVRFGEKEKEILTFVSQQLAGAIEYKRNEDALRRSEARYRSLVQSAVYGIYRSSLEGRFFDVNPALITMLGYDSAEELLALDPKSDVFLDPSEQERVMREFQRGARLDHMEVRWKRKDASAITVRLSGRVVNNPEETAEVVEIIAEDITERRVLENQFRQAQKMEAVGRLAGGVAHDFNNLLMVISGYAEVLLEQTRKGNPLYPKIEAIHQAADRATNLTHQLLAFSRKQLLELKVVDLNIIIEDMERLLRPLIGENIELQTHLAPDLGRTRADAGQIEQVLMNLVVNSKDAMPQGGKITIQTANASLNNEDLRREYTYIQPGSYVVLSVTDTGEGMDKETQLRIFEPFFTTKEKGKGTGLGLSTVYGIIKQSRGYVLVESEPEQGTTFRIYLPRVEDALEPTSAVGAARTHAGGSETVLLVEDEESVRQLVRETLESKGYKVLEAENGEAALQIVATHSGKIDMLITDVVMPGMSGRELSARLCASCPQTKVLYLSGYTEDAIVHEGVVDPDTAFLQKPFTLQMLSRKVREVLSEGSS